MGVVDVLAEDGKGKEAVSTYIKKHSRATSDMHAVHAASQRFHPITYEELMDITRFWVDAALNLERKDLRIMERLVQAQVKHRKVSVKSTGHVQLVRTKQNRRTAAMVRFPLRNNNGDTITFDRRRNTDRRDNLSNSQIAQAASHYGEGNWQKNYSDCTKQSISFLRW